jgi:antitoxin component of MazEF toxin-antitoxin module
VFLEPFRFSLFICFDAFSSREPEATSLENAFLFVQTACRYRLYDLMRLRRNEGDERQHPEIDEASDNADDE